jgi:UDP-3-O-[3-hydroxymyristoyl] glucosamine N-acyltransferase
VLRPEDVVHCPVHALVVKDPYLAFVKALRYLNPEPVNQAGIDSTAVISPSATLHSGVSVGAHAVIGAGVVIEENVHIGAGCVIEQNVRIGKNSRLVANITVCRNVRIGASVLIHPGVVIGADGFGIANEAGRWLKIPQTGSVIIGDDVEIGANTTIDRGAIEDTVIGEGVKIDNQVQVGHNCIIGAHTAIAGCAALAGSVTIGKRCMIGGATAIAGHIEIADDVIITGLSGVTNSIKQAGMYSGAMTTTDNLTWRKNMARIRNLDDLARRVIALEDVIAKDKL